MFFCKITANESLLSRRICNPMTEWNIRIYNPYSVFRIQNYRYRFLSLPDRRSLYSSGDGSQIRRYDLLLYIRTDKTIHCISWQSGFLFFFCVLLLSALIAVKTLFVLTRFRPPLFRLGFNAQNYEKQFIK
jgi:hypothetical protein